MASSAEETDPIWGRRPWKRKRFIGCVGPGREGPAWVDAPDMLDPSTQLTRSRLTSMTGLLDLPPEVLANIYDWLRLIEAPPDEQPYYSPEPTRTWAPVCRALRPFTQAYRFRIVVLRKHAQVRSFSAAVVGSPDLGGAVRRLYLIEPHAAESGAADGLHAVLGRMWSVLGQVRLVRLSGSIAGWETLAGAVERGLELPWLQAIELEACFDASASPYDHPRWRTFLAAAPRLRRLELGFEFVDDQEEDDPALPVSSGPVFPTNLAILKVTCFPASHEPALAAFVNSFPALSCVVLYAGTELLQPRILPLLRAPHARSLQFLWLDEDESTAHPFESLDLRHLPALEHVNFTSTACTPDFRFLLPPGVVSLSIDMLNSVPLAALVALVTPGAPSFQPALALITLDLPFAHDYGKAIEHMSVGQMARLDIDETNTMDWTDEVSREGLMDLITAAEEGGVELAGTCRAAFDFEIAVGMRENGGDSEWDGDSDEYGYEDIRDAYSGRESASDEDEEFPWTPAEFAQLAQAGLAQENRTDLQRGDQAA